MKVLVDFFPKLFIWHFFEAPTKILVIIKNFLKFGNHYFSLGFILRTLFYPWRRIYIVTKGFDPWKILEAIIFNFFSIIIGFLFRIVIFTIGILFEIFVLVVGILVLFFWWFLPLVFVVLIFYGIKFLAKL